VADKWLKCPDRQHLVLKGPTGTGKSWLASRLVQSTMPEKSVRWVSVYTFDPVAMRDELPRLAEVDYLVLDDLGSEWDRPGGSFAGAKLDGLVRAADANLARIIATSNLRANESAGRYSEAMLRRLNEGVVIKMGRSG
jgi:DNA replication protein DnaC